MWLRCLLSWLEPDSGATRWLAGIGRGARPPAPAREIVADVTRQIALLRGINVGKNNRIAMADLRELLGNLGYDDVKTHLMSGNAVFTTTKTPKVVAQEVAKAIDKELLAGIKVVVRSKTELAKVIADNPLPKAADEGSRFLVLFLSDEVDPSVVKDIDTDQFAPEEFRLAQREIYVWCRNGIQDSKLLKALSEKRLGVTATARNWNTVTKLLDLADG